MSAGRCWHLVCWVLGLWLACVLPVQAQAPKVMARATVQSNGPAVAGQQVRLRVDVLTTTWFLQAPVYPQITAPNAIINLLDEQAEHLNETVGGEKWFGLGRDYLVTPTGSGDIVIAPIEVTLYPGQASGAVKVKTREVHIAVKVVERPAGAENMLASTQVSVTQTLDRKLDGLKAGDAFTRTIRVQAAGVQGMFIPPAKFEPIKGLTVYPKVGSVNNIVQERVGFTGSSRVDAATYVVQQAGDYVLPAVTVEWWNTATGKIQKAEVPAMRFSAAANPGYKPEFALPSEQDAAGPVRKSIDWHRVGVMAVLVLAALALLWWLGRSIPRWWQRLQAGLSARRQRRKASEPAAFERLARAAKGGDAAATYAALLAWADHAENLVGGRGMPALLGAMSDPALAQQFDGLRNALYGEMSGTGWQSAELCSLIVAARSRAKRHRAQQRLQLLNP